MGTLVGLYHDVRIAFATRTATPHNSAATEAVRLTMPELAQVVYLPDVELRLIHPDRDRLAWREGEGWVLEDAGPDPAAEARREERARRALENQLIRAEERRAAAERVGLADRAAALQVEVATLRTQLRLPENGIQ